MANPDPPQDNVGKVNVAELAHWVVGSVPAIQWEMHILAKSVLDKQERIEELENKLAQRAMGAGG